VAIARSEEEFVRACEQALAMTPQAKSEMARQMADVVAATSWDDTAKRMHALIEHARSAAQAPAAHASPGGEPQTR